jgi:hypothetical protein
MTGITLARCYASLAWSGSEHESSRGLRTGGSFCLNLRGIW